MPRPDWTRAKVWLRGEPLNVPSHALVVHFPAALLPTSFVLQVTALMYPGLDLGHGAHAILLLGIVGGAVAVGTGVLDWTEMVPGTARRDRVTRHMVVQLIALAGFSVSGLIIVGGDAGSVPAIMIAGASTLILLFGNHLGGLLVYRDAMRVRTSRPTSHRLPQIDQREPDSAVPNTPGG